MLSGSLSQEDEDAVLQELEDLKKVWHPTLMQTPASRIRNLFSNPLKFV